MVIPPQDPRQPTDLRADAEPHRQVQCSPKAPGLGASRPVAGRPGRRLVGGLPKGAANGLLRGPRRRE